MMLNGLHILSVVILLLYYCMVHKMSICFATSPESRSSFFEGHEGFKLVGHVMETRSTDAFGCGMRCLRNENCRSYNSKSDGNHGNMTCELSNQTRLSSPDNLRRNPGFACFEKIVKGWHSSHPGHSCRDILESGDSTGDGEYWIDPERNENPLKVYCDMTTDGGGWLLISNIVIENQTSLPSLTLQTSYRKIDSFGSNKLMLANSALKKLRKHLPFAQIRFHCSKPNGRTFHVATVTNSIGEAVIQYFTGETNILPASCGSFKRMNDDNSNLTKECTEWGLENGRYRVGKWGNQKVGTSRLHNHTAFVFYKYHWLTWSSRWECDDFKVRPSTGDFWKIFVR